MSSVQKVAVTIRRTLTTNGEAMKTQRDVNTSKFPVLPFLDFLNFLGMRLFYLQLRSFYLWFVFFTYGGGTVSKKDQKQFPDGGGGNRKQKRPNQLGGTVSKKDQTDFQP